MTDDELFEDFFKDVAQWDYENLRLMVDRSSRRKYAIQWCDGEFWCEVFDPEVARQSGGLGKLKTLAKDQIRKSHCLKTEQEQ